MLCFFQALIHNHICFILSEILTVTMKFPNEAPFFEKEANYNPPCVVRGMSLSQGVKWSVSMET